ncbi:mediator of DNA damage checkpoint protein 1 isoform X6 [Manis pentadactyla]|uniref:mediator of DNA damage checkpoint protein 1 isoform X6 n=1 Tax=Manis pentadactyla TaxID=143292 RepID=UPI001876448F|nr:mediator of DNA damage checkpoint protein 1 isoform X6 [Manis pentadactyla]
MEDTQAINWEVEEEEETERPSESLGYSLKPVGQLHIFSSAHGPEKDFPLYLGKNVIGRMPDCSVALPFPSISKQHAVIEILALDKAPVLRDCGSLNGTQILRPPKVLSPGMSHRLRDQELILFADLPCQYRRLDVPLPHVSWGPLTVEETPRVQGRTQPQELLLAENSEEEVDSLPERCVVKGPRTSPLASVVPESDEEGPSPAPDGPGPPFAFNLDSDTDEEQRQRPAVGKFSSAARRGATAETEQPKTVSTETQLEKDQCSVKERNKKRTVERDAKKGAVPVGVILEMSPPAGEDSDTGAGRPPGRPAEAHLERAQLSGFIDSDTDVEEEEIPATPAVVPTKKRHIFYEVSIKNSQAPGLAHQQESQTGSDTDVEEGEATLASPLERSQASMLIGSNTGLEEEVSAALTLAQLKESRAIPWSRDTAVEEDRAQPAALLEQSQTPIVRVSDTDVEEEGIPVEKRGTVPKSHTYKAHSEKSQPLLRDSDIKGEEDESLPEVPLERSQASATVDVSTQVEEKVPLGPAVTLLEKRQVLVAGTSQTDVEAEDGPADLPKVHLEEAWSPAGGYRTDVEGGTALAVSAVADVRGSRLLAEGDAETEWAVLEQERALEAGAQDSEDLYLQATQCFVERQDESREDALEEPWEVLATQPFCPRESEASEPQPIAAHLDIHGSCPFPPGATPQDQHPKSPVHAEPLGHLTCKMPPAEKASRDVVIPGPGKRKKDQEEEEPPKGIPSRSLRRTKPNQESTAPKVLFTGVVDARGEHTVLALGGSLASSVAEASHLVTDRIRRTVKFLCALGRGIPILSLDWLHQSRKAGYFLPPDKYVVIDPEQEKNFGFSLQDALSRARKRRLLEGYEIHVTPGVQPPPPQMGEIISCCGGTVLPSMPRSYKVGVPHRVVITCSQDFPRCSTPCRVGLPILSPEFLLTGVLKQEAKPEAFVLSTLKTSST